MIGLRKYWGHPGDEFVKEQGKRITAARRRITKEDKAEAYERNVQKMRGVAVEGEDPMLPVRQALYEWVKVLQKDFAGRIIRRTIHSKKYDGRRINDKLPDYNEILALCILNDAEQERLASELKSLKNRCVT